jgi:hypothetical protein
MGEFLGLKNLLRENYGAVVINEEQTMNRRENDRDEQDGQGPGKGNAKWKRGNLLSSDDKVYINSKYFNYNKERLIMDGNDFAKMYNDKDIFVKL